MNLIEGTNQPFKETPDCHRRHNFLNRMAQGFSRFFFGLLGWLTAIAGLSALAVVPGLNILSLGYLLEVSGRSAKGGRWYQLPGITWLGTVGILMLGAWALSVPVRFMAGLWKDAWMLSPDSGTTRLFACITVLAAALATVHLVWTFLRGGKIRHLIWPAPILAWRWIRGRADLPREGLLLLEYLRQLRPWYYFWLGLRGMLGSVVWLAVPVGILIYASRQPTVPAAFLSLVGGILLATVAMALPFLQARFAQTGRTRSLWEWRAVSALYQRAPLAFALSLTVTLVAATPLYLLKVELTPREVAWLPSLLFVLLMLPARILSGWALHRACIQDDPKPRFWRILSKVWMLPLTLAYALVVYLTQYLSWNGIYSLLEQHAFLVPAPMLSL